MFATVLMSAGLVLALIGAIGSWRGYVTQSWPTTTATLATNTLEKTEETRTIPMTDRLRGGITEIVETEVLALSYRYSVDGVAFEGHKLEPWDFGLPGKAKARDIAALGSGGTHPVAYDPRDPRRAYLKPGPSTDSSDARNDWRGAHGGRFSHGTYSAPRMRYARRFRYRGIGRCAF